MKLSLRPLLFGAAVLLAIALTVAAQRANPPVSILISAAPSVKAGSKILLDTTMTNISGHPLTVFFEDTTHNEFNYDFDVCDGAGKPMTETSYMKDVTGSEKGFSGHLGPGGYAMKQGETIKSSADLNQLYVLPPGQYTVQLSWFEIFTRFRDPKKPRPPIGVMTVTSNRITVTVTP